MKARVRELDCWRRFLPVQVYVLLNGDWDWTMYRQWGRQSAWVVCMRACASACLWIKSFPWLLFKPPVRSSVEVGSHRWLVPHLQEKSRVKNDRPLNLTISTSDTLKLWHQCTCHYKYRGPCLTSAGMWMSICVKRFNWNVLGTIAGHSSFHSKK